MAVSVTLSPVVGEVVDASSTVVVDVRLDEEQVIVIAPDVLAAYSLAPAYVAVIVCVPVVENEVVSVAVPELKVAVPNDVVPS